MWRARFGRGFGPVVRQTTKMNEYKCKRARNYVDPTPVVPKMSAAPSVHENSRFCTNITQYGTLVLVLSRTAASEVITVVTRGNWSAGGSNSVFNRGFVTF